MKSANFKPFDPISIHSFLHNFKTACDRNGIHRDAAMRPFPHFMKDPAKASLAHRVSATKEDVLEQEGKLTTYSEVGNYLPATFDTDDVIADMEAGITNFKHLEGMTAVCYSEVL